MNKLLAEFFGTFWLVFAGCGSAVLAAAFPDAANSLGIGLLGVSLAFGAFFPSRTKANTRHATPDLLAATAALGVPRVAIGGITPENARQLATAGADLVAVISGVFAARHPAAAAHAYRAAFGL